MNTIEIMRALAKSRVQLVETQKHYDEMREYLRTLTEGIYGEAAMSLRYNDPTAYLGIVDQTLVVGNSCELIALEIREHEEFISICESMLRDEEE